MRLESKNYAYLFGFLVGILGGAYNTSGPPIVIYGTLREWSPERFRATLQGYFFPTELIILVMNAIYGLWTKEVLRYYLISLPFIIIAAFLGGIFNRGLSGKRYNPLIYSLLIVLGLLLVIRS